MTSEATMPAATSPATGASGSGSGPMTFDAACQACINETRRMGSRWARASRVVKLHGHRRHGELTRLSATIVRTVRETSIGLLTPGEQEQFRALVADAVGRLRAGDGIAGWDALHAARRVALGALEGDDNGRQVAGVLIRAEVSEKLKEWRKEAALGALSAGGEERAPTVTELRAAQLQLDESSSNGFRRLDVFGSVLTFILYGLFVTLGLLLAAVRFDWLPSLEGEARPLDTAAEVVGVITLGALGSFLSVALTRFAGRQQKLPEMVQGRLVDILRPLIGGASAVALVLVLDSGLQTAVLADDSKVYVWAVVAGFSERLLRRTLTSLADTVEAGPTKESSVGD